MPEDEGKVGILNWSVAIAAGLICAVAMLIWGVPGMGPQEWDEAAVVAGLLPPKTIFPGFWRLITGWMFSAFGVKAATGLLNIVGALVGGVTVSLYCVCVRQLLAMLFHNSKTYAVWYKMIAPFFAFVAALTFGLGDPFWRICRVFSPELFRFTSLMVVIFLSFRWFACGSRWRLFPLFAMMGCMAAETPSGFLLPLFFMLAFFVVWKCIENGELLQPLKLPDFSSLPKWRMFFLFLGGLALIVYVNSMRFVQLGGLDANGWSINDIYFRYGGGYWHVLADASTIIGWVLGLGVCVLPLIVAMKIFPRIIHDDRPMPFNLGVLLFFIGSIAIMQTGAFPAANFWTFMRDVVMVPSGFLLSTFHMCAMTSLALFGSAFAFECHRVYLTEYEKKPGILLKGVVPVLTFALVALAITRVPKPVETEMQNIVDDAVDEIVTECGDANWLFTDGRMDSAILLVAAERHLPLKPLNMMSGASDWEVYVRKNYFAPDSEDRNSAETGIPTLLRIWAGEKANGMDKVAIQLGFEFWKREHKDLPKLSGMIARETGLSDADAKKGIENARKLSERILAVSGKMEKAQPSPALASAISAVSWRLSRFARLRNDEKLANDLDVSNGALKRMLSIIEYERLRTFMQLTPREGLQLALKRADFTEARRYSAAVLRYSADDPEANFGMGMAALMVNRLDEAERYLKCCLKRRPEEPAVLNNLSIICRKQKRYEEAVMYAKKAIALLPASPEVKQTLSDALKKAP